jgi:predicted enzyme related to lactoylglutathione lyase
VREADETDRDTVEHRSVAMGTVRFNHMELTFEPGTLTADVRDEIAEFYGDLFGWRFSDTEVVNQKCLLIQPDDGQFILCAESPKFMQSPGYDHLGLLMDTRTEVDAVLAKAKRWRERDDRVRIKEYQDLVYPQLTVHAFYVRHLLPIWFDVQCMERPDGASGPPRTWRYVEA